MTSTIILLTVTVVACVLTTAAGDCYTNWSRCTPETAAATGILWKSCPEYCRKCKGREGGNCVDVPPAECSGGQRCDCTGGQIEPSSNWIDIATCKLGL